MARMRWACEFIARPIATRELDSQAISVEIGSVFREQSLLFGMDRLWETYAWLFGELAEFQNLDQGQKMPTRHHIPSIQRIVVLNESEAVHQLNLGDIASAILGEVGLDIFLGDCSKVLNVSDSLVSFTTDQRRNHGEAPLSARPVPWIQVVRQLPIAGDSPKQHP